MNSTVSIKKNYQFRIVYNKGKSLANRNLVLYVLRNNTAGNKVGISVSKKIGKAVTRNRVKRLIKEAYREISGNVKVGYDLVFIARMPVASAEYKEVVRNINHLLAKHNLLEV